MPFQAEPQQEHRWLQKFVGDWVYEGECLMGPDQPPEKNTGTESVRAIGELWIMGEGKGEMPGGEPATMFLTVGYDPQQKKYVGSWIGSMMTHLWVYEGALDESGKILTLESDGPDFVIEGKTARYRDTFEFASDDHRILRSSVRGDDGSWTTFMTSHYRRK